MSLRALPLMAIPLILYNVLVMFSGGEAAAVLQRRRCSRCRMIKGASGCSRAAT